MREQKYIGILIEQMERALWEVQNVIDCISDELWEKKFCEISCSRHVYHMLHSLDLWFINPVDANYEEPYFHTKDLNNLDVGMNHQVLRNDIECYFKRTEEKIINYLDGMTEEQLLVKPEGCKYDRFTLMIAQIRHFHTHMGMLMGFIVAEEGLWPSVLGLEKPFPTGEYCKYM